MINRRTFVASALAMAGVRSTFAARQFKVVKLFKSPDGYPNGIATDPKRGIWIGEEMTDMAYLVDMKGKVLQKVQTECANTSGIAYGGGYLWLSSNGEPLRRPPKPTDFTVIQHKEGGAVIKTDPKTGKTMARYPVPGGSTPKDAGIHGVLWTPENKLWIATLHLKKLTEVDPKDFRILRQIPVQYGRAHGLAWDPPGIWCIFTTDRLIQKLDPNSGKVLDEITISKEDPEPHGLCLREGHLYYSDSNVERPGTERPPGSGYVCRIDFV